MSEYLNKLNKAQYDAATTIDGRILILAGAGSGKTFTLVSRVAYMLEQGIPGDSILLLTFTNKAANEMKSRVSKMIGPAADTVVASTFHSFCATFLRSGAKFLNISPNFNVIDGPDALDAMKLARQNFLDEKKKEGIEYDLKSMPTAKCILNIHEAYINNCQKIEDIIFEYDFYSRAEEIIEIDKRFTIYKQERNLLDYNDLLYYTKKLLSENALIRTSIDKRFRYIMVDEYQDTNTIQNEILDLMTKDYSNLAVVGDDSQSIYAFRFANIDNILSFDIRCDNCKTIVLDENYRSSQEILDLSNAVMQYATEGKTKTLHGQFNHLKPKLVMVDSEYAEADFIADEIERLHFEENIPYKEMAVIERSARQSFMLESKLNTCNIPFKKFGGIKFLEKEVVKDILSFLRVSVNHQDELAWFRLLKLYPGIGTVYAKKISNKIISDGIDVLKTIYPKSKFAPYLIEIHQNISDISSAKLSEQLSYLLETYYPFVANRQIDLSSSKDTTKFEDRKRLEEAIEEARALYSLAEKYRTTLKFLSDLTLDATSETADIDDFLNITTIHSAKGLEYTVVFVLDVVEGITPRCNAGDAEDPEELRCFYVAITRAKELLYIMVPETSVMSNGGFRNSISHFIDKEDIISCFDSIDKRCRGYSFRNFSNKEWF